MGTGVVGVAGRLALILIAEKGGKRACQGVASIPARELTARVTVSNMLNVLDPVQVSTINCWQVVFTYLKKLMENGGSGEGGKSVPKNVELARPREQENVMIPLRKMEATTALDLIYRKQVVICYLAHNMYNIYMPF